MTDAAGLPPPGLILILGGLLLPWLRGAAPVVALALPLLTSPHWNLQSLTGELLWCLAEESSREYLRLVGFGYGVG